ncbi:hypothetical protein IKF15_03070 [Candidatus Saccharibacteria bacterium]|nr:hypothetical protein [Candidatus Saccharibacteria bacterium]
MLEFKITQELKPNPKLLELIKDFTYKTKKGKVKVQEKRLVDLYLSSTLDVETINHKNDVIKKRN